MSKNMAAYPAKAKIYADRRTTNRLYVSPRCRSRVPRGDALVYRLCSGVYNMMPYIISLVVLAFTSKKSRAPKAEGIPYDKGQR